jgi:hypothetical protein
MKEEPARKHEALVDSQVHRLSRRNFVKGAATLAAVTATVSVKPILDGTASLVEAAGGNASDRSHECFNYRKNVALAHKVNIKPRADNGDAARFTDFSWCYSKGLPHDSLGIPNPQAILSLKNAFKSGKSADFANIIIGTPRGGPNSKLTCPQSALAFDLEGMDSHSTVIPPAPCVDSAQTAAEQVELYWAALLADVPFTEYATNELVGQAVSDMNNLSFLSSPANNQFPYPVTRQNLFRGQFGRGDGNLKGPYLSQFMIQPTFFGSQPINQQHKVFLPAGGGGRNYLTSVNEYQLVQNGGDTRLPIKYDLTPRYLRNGRDLAAYTRVDQPYQPYLVAFLVLTGLGAAPNPASPYIRSLSQKPFATLGGADAATTLAEMSTRALKAAWFHKWIKDMRIRPEEYGALVYARKTNASPMPQAAAALHNDVLNSSALLLTYSNYGTYLLPQPFPEGSPTHPCYPTGHGAVGGACITALKFFFNGNQKLRPLLTAGGRDVYEPSFDGLSLNTHSNDVRHLLDINGELNKLAYNVSFGHGIHAGIHFRSSTYWSILLGEQVALSVLQDRAKSYNEPFTISITKFDGTTATISNEKDVVRTD